MIRHRTILRAAMSGLAAVIVATGLAPAAHAGGTVAAAPAPIHSVTYKTWFTEGFDRGNVTPNGWATSPYAKRFLAYDGFTERNVGPVVFDQDTLQVHDSHLDIFGFKRQRADGVWEPVGGGVAPKLGGKYVGFRYGRFSFDLEAKPVGPDGMTNWWFAGLLWPQATPGHPGGDHCLGELDFPEFVPGKWAKFFQHIAGDRQADGSCTSNPDVNCFSGESLDWVTTGSHRYSMTWLPTGVTYQRDGKTVGQSACSVPDVPMQLKLQLVSLNKMPSGGSFGHIYLDNIVVEKAYYQQG